MCAKVLPISKLVSILLILFLFISSIAASAFAPPAFGTTYNLTNISPVNNPPNVTARSAIAIDFYTGEILFERDIDTVRSLASMTKNMTAFIVYEEIAAGRLTLDTMIRVSQHSVNISRSYDWHRSTIFNTVGAYYSVETMLRLIMLPSHNGASVAMAEHIAGSEAEFVDRMNAEASRLEINAWFVDAFGTPGNQASARGMATLVRTFIQDHPDMLRITSMVTMPFRGDTVPNTNLLLPGRDFYLTGVDGFKTGTSAAAGHNLSSTATRDGNRIVTVVMNAPNNNVRYGDTRALFNFGFNELANRVFTHELNVNMTSQDGQIQRNVDFYVQAHLDSPGDGFLAGGSWTVNGRVVDTFGGFRLGDVRTHTLEHWIPASFEGEYVDIVFIVNLPDNTSRTASIQLPVSDEPASIFRDTNRHWGENEIRRAVERGLFLGVGNDLFAPNGVMTRAAFVTVLGRMANSFGIDISSSGFTHFYDVPSGNWAANYVAWAYETGIVTGIAYKYFGANNPVTRQEVATIFYRFKEYYGIILEGGAPMEFTDVDRISDWALEAMTEAVRTGLITGYHDGRLAPRDTATRAQLAVIFLRFLDGVLGEDYVVLDGALNEDADADDDEEEADEN